MRRDSLVAQHYPPGLFAATLPITQAPHRVQHYKPWPIEMLELWLTHADPCLTHVVRFLAATRLRISDALRVTQQQADDGQNGIKLWVTDGTETGTVMVENIPPSSGAIRQVAVELNGSLIFEADDSSSIGRELWITDGTSSGTQLLLNINQSGAGEATKWLGKINGKQLFSADMGANGIQLWVTDGTANGTILLKDIERNDSVVLGDRMYLSADDGVTGNELWVTDGTEEGTYMVRDINLGGDSFPDSHFEFNDRLFISADDGVHGWELWAVS